MSLATLIAYLIAIAVPVFAIYLIFALDLFGTSKSSTVVICLAWGATGAVGLAYLVNTLAANWLGDATMRTLTAPIAEEILKALILIYFIRQPRFRYVVDGAIYGFAAGIGFAMLENVYYLSTTGGAVSLAISRVLSASLMHATASALVGLSLGRLRRALSRQKMIWPLLGIGIAIALHSFYNRTVMATRFDGTVLLVAAIGIGVGGGILIILLINQGLAEEKTRFSETLGLHVGVSVGERKAVQQLGGTAIEQIFQDLSAYFGPDNVALIRRLLATEANIGILQNNLQGSISERLQAAWREEIADLRAEAQQLRAALGRYVMSYLDNVFPSSDTGLWKAINQELSEFDTTLVHTFDMFMRVSEMAETFPPEQLQQIAEKLKQTSLFRNVSLADLENLSRAITSAAYDDGQLLFQKGDSGDAMYLIESGHVHIFTDDPGEPEKLFRILKPGDIVGDFAVLDGQPRSAGARAHGALTVWVLRREVFMMFIRSRPKVIMAVLQGLVEKVRYTTTAIENTVRWATLIAEGHYQQMHMRDTDEVPTLVLPAEPAPPSHSEAWVLQPIQAAFVRAAAVLHGREQTLRGSRQ